MNKKEKQEKQHNKAMLFGIPCVVCEKTIFIDKLTFLQSSIMNPNLLLVCSNECQTTFYHQQVPCHELVDDLVDLEGNIIQ